MRSVNQIATSGAYPRAGGGTPSRHARSRFMAGLSPRGRGNHREQEVDARVVGPIPARAGEPPGCGARRRCPRAYPRAGGGTDVDRHGDGAETGLSPRGRGNHRDRHHGARHPGPIPARAGEPSRTSSCARRIGAYPRAGGGTRRDDARRRHGAGLSPRGRGNRDRRHDLGAARGPIPARAGEPTAGYLWSNAVGAYPRAGGGTSLWMGQVHAGSGLSPRGRGNLELPRLPGSGVGPIPARAGEPAVCCRGCSAGGAYPRAGGGTAGARAGENRARGLSPRGRGNPLLPSP